MESGLNTELAGAGLMTGPVPVKHSRAHEAAVLRAHSCKAKNSGLRRCPDRMRRRDLCARH